MHSIFMQVLILLATSVSIILLCQRLHVPTSLGYLLIGLILGPYTLGPTLEIEEIHAVAEFGVVFLLFTIGLSYSLPQLNSLRGQLLKLGLAQVFVGTALVTGLLYAFGMPLVVAFVFGAVFAQSSSTIIGRQLAEQGEANTPSGRLGLAMSVFQDVTAVPFLVIFPVLGTTVAVAALAGTLAMAIAKAALAFVLVFFLSRWLLKPLFHQVTRYQSLELLTLAVLFVVLLAAWSSEQLGLSLAFGAFLAGMMLGETEFRHQVESAIRPFRDVLLGLFFVSIGMLLDPQALMAVWSWALLSALGLLASKIVLVGVIVWRSGFDKVSAWRTALIVAVGGEFGLALLAIALDAGLLSAELGQILLAAILISMLAGAMLIKFNHRIALWLAGTNAPLLAPQESPPEVAPQQVLLGGYGRVGHTLAVLLKSANIPFVVFDNDPARVRQGRIDGMPIYVGDIGDPGLLETIHAEKSALIIVSSYQDDMGIRAAHFVRKRCPHIPIIARARDLQMSSALKEAGATHAYPELIESSLRLAATAMTLLNVPTHHIDQLLDEVRAWDYQPVLDEEKEA